MTANDNRQPGAPRPDRLQAAEQPIPSPVTNLVPPAQNAPDEENEAYWKAYVAARGGPLARDPRRRTAPQHQAYSDYARWRRKELVDAALASASAVLGKQFDLTNAGHRAEYNASLVGIPETYRLTDDDGSDPIKDLFKVKQGEHRRALWQQQQQQRADHSAADDARPTSTRDKRTAQVDAEIATVHAAYDSDPDRLKALGAVKRTMDDLKARDPALAAACGYRLIALLVHWNWPEHIAAKAGVEAGLSEASSERWVRKVFRERTAS